VTDLVRIEFEDGRLLPYLGRRSLTNGGRSVVVRVWRGKSSAANAGSYKRFLQEAAERSAPGPSDMHQQVWVRQGRVENSVGEHSASTMGEARMLRARFKIAEDVPRDDLREARATHPGRSCAGEAEGLMG